MKLNTQKKMNLKKLKDKIVEVTWTDIFAELCKDIEELNDNLDESLIRVKTYGVVGRVTENTVEILNSVDTLQVDRNVIPISVIEDVRVLK